MESCNPVYTPVEIGQELRKHDGEAKVDPTYFKSLVGSLRYLTCTRPDILYGVGLISRYMETPSQSHLNAVKGILRYIKVCRSSVVCSAAKGQDTFTPISSILPKSMLPDPHNIELWLKVDGQIRQKGSTSDMIFKIPFLISHISSLFTLLEGDLILTAYAHNVKQFAVLLRTPKGAGPVKIG
ncbi:hypothetical protein SASPL_145377 [Salvia splendens]|uniref:Fumarylacetoacetase-like C-terminal domain-containing protein n=1 Tax=Salvia splendens TaxID=180675 RepID=A0A8X8Z833_SALSN|nr:hypothetical protein SASPL_145377 [Salvia splendens]